MRFLVNGYGAYLGGIVRVHNSICRELSSRYEVSVANAPRGQETGLPLRVVSRQSASRVRSLLGDLAASLRFEKFDVRIDSAPALRFFTRSRLHLLIVHDLNFMQPRIHRISRKQRFYRHILHRWTLKRVDRIVVNSAQSLEELRRFMPSAAAKAVALPLPVDYMPVPIESTAQADPGTHLLSFGHARNKGVDRLLEALEKRTELRLTVVCPAAAWHEFWEDRARVLGVRDRVTVRSGLSDAELAEQYAAADVFCMLSTYEGYGLPVAEALALSRPTIVSSLAVLIETSRGFAQVASTDDVDGVLNAIDAALAKPADHWKAASEVMRGWTWKAWVDEMLGAGV